MHDLIFGILEDRGDRPGQVGGPGAARVQAGDVDLTGEAPAVEVRHEAGQSA